MKKRHTTTLELYAKTLRMRAAEKRALRERLVSYMEYHPSRVSLLEADAAPVESPFSALSNDSFVTLRFSSWQFRTAFSFFALVLMVGAPLVAERTVPGDMLYPMKVRVNEEVKASFAWSPAEKIAWQAERMERRISEARLLAKEGNLTSEAEAAIALTVREHAENASREIAELRTTDAEGAAVAQVALKSTLEVQTAILATESGSTTSSTTIDSLAATVKDVQEGVGAHEPAFEPLSYERMAALLESETTRARELNASLKKGIKEATQKDIERRLTDIERSIAESRIMQKADQSIQALELQRTILFDIQKLIAYMSDIEVRESISLEKIVPMKLTAEEKLIIVSSELETLKNDALVVKERGTNISDDDISKKYTIGEADLKNLIVSIEALRSEGKYEEALGLIANARALVTDLAALALTNPEDGSSEAATTTPATKQGEQTASSTTGSTTRTTE